MQRRYRTGCWNPTAPDAQATRWGTRGCFVRTTRIPIAEGRTSLSWAAARGLLPRLLEAVPLRVTVHEHVVCTTLMAADSHTARFPSFVVPFHFVFL